MILSTSKIRSYFTPRITSKLEFQYSSNTTPSEIKGLSTDENKKKRLCDTALYNDLQQIPKKVNQFLPFDVANYRVTFPTFELNDDNDDSLPFCGRSVQVTAIRENFEYLDTHPKFRPIIITAPRGMGKTIGLHQDSDEINIPRVKSASLVGRVVSIECGQYYDAFKSDDPIYIANHFWSRLIVFHIRNLFNGYRVDNIDFVSDKLTDVLDASKEWYSPSFKSWLLRMQSYDLRSLCEELIRLTNIAFGTKNDTRPIFLLDNAHVIANIEIFSKSSFLPKNTILSSIMIDMTPYRIPMICAGTTHNQLLQATDGTSFVPIFLTLDTLNFPLAQDILSRSIQHFNESSNTPIDIPMIVDSPFFLSLFSQTCFIPRLMKIAIGCWINFMSKNTVSDEDFIFSTFRQQSRLYYHEVIKLFESYSTQEIAYILLFCAVDLPLEGEYCIPHTGLKVSDLIHNAIIFPVKSGYYSFGSKLNSYVIPQILLWDNENDNSKDLKWQKVDFEISKLVPSLKISNLYLSVDIWNQNLSNSTYQRLVWQSIIASSIIAKYLLLRSDSSSGIPLYQIVEIERNPKSNMRCSLTPTRNALNSDDVFPDLTVNFNNGFHKSTIPITDNSLSEFSNMVLVDVSNSVSILNFDGYIYSSVDNSGPQIILPFQNKLTLNPPIMKEVAKQLDLVNSYKSLSDNSILFWFSLYDKNESLNISNRKVKRAFRDGKIVFLDGSSIVSQNTLNQLKYLVRN